MPRPEGERDRASPRSAYDAIVFGGGPAGAAMALALQRKGLSTAVLTKPGGNAPRIGESVPPTIKCGLAALGLWEKFLAAAHVAAPGTVVVWGNERPYENDFVFNPYGSGWHLDRVRFDAMLIEAARAGGADVRNGSASDCTSDPIVGWKVRIDGADGHPTVLTARWAIDATGRAAWLSKRLGARRQRVDKLVALVRFAEVASVGELRTLIEACADGWWYAAALPRNRVVAAFFTDADLLPSGLRERIRLWDRMLAGTQLIAGVFPASHGALPLRIMAACSGRVLPCAGPRWLAIGDAALSHDPLSGRGVSRAIESAQNAAEIVAADSEDRRLTVEGFREAANRQYETYLAARAFHYRRETRWPQHEFWNRRSEPHTQVRGCASV